MTRQRYPETFTIEAVKQVTERGRPVATQVVGLQKVLPFTAGKLAALIRMHQ